MITEGTLKYQVVGNPNETDPEYSNYTRVWLRDVNRHFFDAFPAKSTMHLNDDTNEYYHIKVFRRKNTEIWLTCHEDENGNRYGVLPPEEPSNNASSRPLEGGANLPALVASIEDESPA